MVRFYAELNFNCFLIQISNDVDSKTEKRAFLAIQKFS